MVDEKTWEEFKDSGLLWWVNMIIHTFGWAIVYESENGTLSRVYPARVKYRGFDEKSNDEGYEKVTRYMKENAENLLKETGVSNQQQIKGMSGKILKIINELSKFEDRFAMWATQNTLLFLTMLSSGFLSGATITFYLFKNWVR